MMSNKIVATVDIKQHRIDLNYEYEGKPYTIEVPQTELNMGMKQDEQVLVLLTVMPLDNPEVQLGVSDA